MVKCINCGIEGENNYCSHCGQKLDPGRITWKYVSSELSDKWVGFDNKFARTVSDLVVRPEAVPTAYLQRNTVKYMGPLAYLVVMTALLMLSFELLGIDLQQYLQETQRAMGVSQFEGTERQANMQVAVMKWVAGNFRIVAGLMVPFFAIGIRLSYRKRKVTFLESLVDAAYLQAHTIWLSIIFLVVYAVSGVILSSVQILVAVVYYGWALMQIYPGKRKVLRFLKGMLTFVIGYLVFMASAAIIGALVGATYGILSR